MTYSLDLEGHRAWSRTASITGTEYVMAAPTGWRRSAQGLASQQAGEQSVEQWG